MQPIPVTVAPRLATTSSLEEDLERARQLATWMDAKFNIAGIDFGLDALIGLIPVVGDTLTSLIGLYPIHLARKHNLSRLVQTRMATNLAADWAIGLLPVVGDAFDIAFKAHRKNFAIFEKAAERHLRRRR